MNRFLKDELERLKVPPSFCEEIRNAAWRRMMEEEVAQTKRYYWWLSATAAIFLSLLMAWSTISSHRPLTAELARQPATLLPIKRRPLSQALLPMPALSGSVFFQTGETFSKRKPSFPPTVAQENPARAAASGLEELERITVEMPLPETGARLIWIKDRNFDLEGGSQ